LATTLRDRAQLDPAAADALVARLGVALRGLDASHDRPDAVVLLAGGAAAGASPLAAAIARTIFARETAVIDLDLAPLTDDSSISTLLGSAPGLIASDRPLPLHELRRSPWQVVVFRGIDACAISIRDTVASALAAGAFTDAMGRRIPLGTAIVILTAPGVETGGANTPPAVPAGVILAARLGPALLAACDVVTGTPSAAPADQRAAWLRRELLDPLADRLARAGYPATFEPEFVAWVDGRLPTDGRSLEAFLDADVTAPLVSMLPRTTGPVRVSVVDGSPAVTPVTTVAPVAEAPAASSG